MDGAGTNELVHHIRSEATPDGQPLHVSQAQAAPYKGSLSPL
jgi:hypothetical protein